MTNLASRNYQEKRNFIRMKVETPIEVQLQKGGQLSGTCHNLSGGGMLVSLPEPVPLGTTMEAIVSSNHGHNPMLKAMVSVKRLDPKPQRESSHCQMGLEIVALLD